MAKLSKEEQLGKSQIEEQEALEKVLEIGFLSEDFKSTIRRHVTNITNLAYERGKIENEL